MAEELKIEEQIQNPVDKTKVLYDAVSKDYNIGSYDEFSKKLKDPTKRKAFYDGVGSEYKLGTFEDFSNKIGVTSLKKKELSLPSGEISSLTELPSEFIEPLKKGVNPNPTKEEQKLAKILGVTPSKGMVMPTNLPKQEAISYQKQLKVKEGAINTLDNLYKSKGLKFNPNSKRGQEQVQEYINKEKDNDLGLVQGTHDQKPYLTRTAGLGESFVNSLVSSFKEPVESFKINMTSSPSELADLLDQKTKEQPNVPESVSSKFGGYYGQLAGGLPKMLGELAIPYVGGSVMAGEMYHNSIANQRASLYQKGIEEGLSREESAKKAMEAAPVTAIPEAAMGAFLARGAGGAQVLKEGTKNAFKEAAVNFAKSVPTMAALGGGAELGRGVAEYAQGYKVDPTKVVENALQAGGEWGLMDAAFKIVHASQYVPKYLVSAAKNVLSEVPKPILEAEASKFETKDKIINDVENFAKTKEEVKKVVPVTDEKVASVTGITEKIQNLEKNIQDLNEQKKTTPEALHPYIDEWVKEYQDEADSYKNKMNKIVESKDLTGMNEEVDDVTGEKASEIPRFKQEAKLTDLEARKADIEKRRKEELASVPNLSLDLNKEENQKIIDKADEIYAKYDAELKALEEVKPTEVKETIKTEENAIQEPSTGEVFQRAQEGIGEAGGERQRVEPSVQGVEVTKEGKQIKVNEEKVTPSIESREFTTSKKYTIEYKDGNLLVKDRKGEPLSERASRKALQEYADNFDYSKGERAPEVPSEIVDPKQASQFVIEESNNPSEIAQAYLGEAKAPLEGNTKFQAIAEYGLGRVTTDSYKRFGDVNKMEPGIKLRYLTKEGFTIDQRAEEISGKTGLDITPQDIVDYIEKYSKGDYKAMQEQETNVALQAKDKFKQLTGLELNEELANKILDKELEKATQEELDIIKQDYETAKQLEDAYWAEYEKTDGFTKEAPVSEVSEPKVTKEEVKEPVSENEFLYKGTDEERKKGLLKNLMKSDIPEDYKKGLEEKGLTYKVSNQVEASEAAKAIIASLGINDALEIARSEKVDPSVGSAIYAESLNNLWSNERKLKAEGKTEEARAAAKQWSDVTMEYADKLNSKGKWTAQTAYFYKTSPMGFAIRIENERVEQFASWFEAKEKDYKKVFNEILQSEEGQALLKEEVEKITKAERAQQRQKRDKAIDSFFDGMKLKGGTYVTIIPPNVWNAAVDIMKVSVKAGDRVVVAVENAIKHIDKELNGAEWDKDKFRKEYEAKLTKVTEEKSDVDVLANKIKSLQKQIEDYKKRISEGGTLKPKSLEKFADNEEVKKLKAEREALQKENQNLLKDKKEGRYSDESRIEQSKKKILKNIEELEAKIEENDLEIEKPEKLNSVELNQLKDKQKALRKELEDRRKEAGIGKYSEEAKYDAKVKRNKDRIAELNRRMAEGDFSSEAYKAKKEKDVLDKELEAVKEKYDEAKRNSEEYVDKKAKQYLDRLRKRLSGISEDQKEEIIRRSIKEIVNKGGLEYEDFKDIVSETIGIKKLSDEQKAEIESLTEQSNIADDLEQKFLDNPTRENIDAFKKAKAKSLEADRKLFEMTSQKADIVGTLKSLITLNYLSASTLIKNYAQNVIYQGTVRFPISLAKKGIDQSVYGATYMANKMFGTKVIKPSISITDAQRGYFKEYREGIVRGWEQTIKGVDEKDYFAKNQYASTLNPSKSVKELKANMKGELFLTPNQKIDKWIQATLGWQPYAISRGMIYGDKPPRYAAQGAEALQIAHKELGLTSPLEMEAFMISPEKYAYKHLIEKAGLSTEDASIESKAIAKRIVDAGAVATFQNENYLNDIFSKLDEVAKVAKDDKWSLKIIKPPLALLKTTTFPFVKTPANIAWAFFKIANPSLTMSKSLVEAGLAQNALRKGNLIEYRQYSKNAKESFGMAAVGMAITAAAASMAAKGLIRTSIQEDDKPREKAGEGFFGKSNQVNLGVLMGGEDFWVDLSWFGPIGTIIDIKGRQMEDNRQKLLKGEKLDDGVMNDIISTMSYSVSSTLNTLVFDQGAKMVDAFRKGGGSLNQVVINNANALSNIVLGSTIASMNKAMAPEKADLAADNIIDQIINNQKQRNVFVTWAAGYPPSKVSIWGEPITQDRSVSGVLGSMLGWEKGSADKFGAILYNEQRRTGINEFFPPVEDKKIKVNGKDVQITVEEKRDLDTYIGQARKAMISPFLNDKSTYSVLLENGEYGEFTYSELTAGKNKEGQTISQDEADKKKLAALDVIYKNGKEAGFAKFKEKYVQYQDATLDVEKIKKKAYEGAEKAIFEAKLQRQPE